jgi:hypothetical protein
LESQLARVVCGAPWSGYFLPDRKLDYTALGRLCRNLVSRSAPDAWLPAGMWSCLEADMIGDIGV